jgi:hypothetical protein
MLLFSFYLYCQPILVVTQEKSGTTHLHASLGQYFQVHWETGRRMICTNEDGTSSGLVLKPENFLRVVKICKDKNIPIVDHFTITEDFFSYVVSSGNRIAFVPRDPRSAITSKAIHQVLNNNSQDWKDQHLAEDGKIKNLSKIRSYIDILIKQGELDNRIKELNKWMAWKRAYPRIVNICSFELLKKNRILFFRNLLSIFRIKSKKIKHVPGPPLGLCRYRKSPDNEWKTILTEEQKQLIFRKMNKRLLRFYGWESS